MNRSICASGSGYVPSCSIGFCVASTRNGSSRVYVVPPMVTFFSCMASSSAACTLAGGRLIVHLGTDHVCRKQIGSELNALERRADRLRQSPHGEGLRQPWYTFQQHVAAGEQSHKQPFDHVVLAYNTLAYFTDYRVDECRVFHLV